MLDPEREGHVHGWVQLDGPALPTSVRVALPELESRVEVVTDDQGRAEFQLDAVPERWSPESPRLYRVEIAKAISITPDLQLVFDPADNPGDDFVVVPGVRLHIKF